MTVDIYAPIAPAFLDKNLIADQTWTNLLLKFGVGTGFDAAKGLGQANAVTVTVMGPGGFNRQRITATMQFPAPTAAGAEFLGVMLHCVQLDTTSNYYFVCLFQGTARIVTVINGVFTTVANTPFAVAQGQSFTITADIIKSLITAKFDAGGAPATVNISATDANLTRGFTAFSSISSAIWVSAFKSEQI